MRSMMERIQSPATPTKSVVSDMLTPYADPGRQTGGQGKREVKATDGCAWIPRRHRSRRVSRRGCLLVLIDARP